MASNAPRGFEHRREGIPEIAVRDDAHQAAVYDHWELIDAVPLEELPRMPDGVEGLHRDDCPMDEWRNLHADPSAQAPCQGVRQHLPPPVRKRGNTGRRLCQRCDASSPG